MSSELRPFQPVFYLTDSIKNQIEWRGQVLSILLDLKQASEILGDDDLLTFVALNDEYNDKNFPRTPKALGIETIMRLWSNGVKNSDDRDTKETLERLKNRISLRQHNSALEKSLKISDDSVVDADSRGYEIIHEPDHIFVILNKSANLLDPMVTKAMDKDITKDVVRTYQKYYMYHDVPNSPWFKQYLINL